MKTSNGENSIPNKSMNNNNNQNSPGFTNNNNSNQKNPNDFNVNLFILFIIIFRINLIKIQTIYPIT